VKFDTNKVTSTDWIGYPILEMPDAPEQIDCVLINRPEIDPTGAGEPTIRVIPAAVANAFFDATGVRLRRAPLTPQRVKTALLRTA
jgi:CO/xanthine dehydrogenase Mo-binding subunit